jgi:hypothetical protein
MRLKSIGVKIAFQAFGKLKPPSQQVSPKIKKMNYTALFIR